MYSTSAFSFLLHDQRAVFRPPKKGHSRKGESSLQPILKVHERSPSRILLRLAVIVEALCRDLLLRSACGRLETLGEMEMEHTTDCTNWSMDTFFSASVMFHTIFG